MIVVTRHAIVATGTHAVIKEFPVRVEYSAGR